MAEKGIPAEVERFIATHIESVEQLEVLLMLRAAPDKSWSAEEVARALVIQRESAGNRLADLHARGLLASSQEGDDRYRYDPVKGGTDRLVDGLAEAYARRRVTVITLIFSKPSDAVTSFSDAFRIRRERE